MAICSVGKDPAREKLIRQIRRELDQLPREQQEMAAAFALGLQMGMALGSVGRSTAAGEPASPGTGSSAPGTGPWDGFAVGSPTADGKRG